MRRDSEEQSQLARQQCLNVSAHSMRSRTLATVKVPHKDKSFGIAHRNFHRTPDTGYLLRLIQAYTASAPTSRSLAIAGRYDDLRLASFASVAHSLVSCRRRQCLADYDDANEAGLDAVVGSVKQRTDGRPPALVVAPVLLRYPKHCRMISAKKRSTMLSQEADVGVKCK